MIKSRLKESDDMNSYGSKEYNEYVDDYFNNWLNDCVHTDTENIEYNWKHCKMLLEQHNYENKEKHKSGQKVFLKIFLNDKEIYSCLCSEITFAYKYNHNNDDYLIFNKHLYGYTILNLNTLEEYNYFPSDITDHKDEALIITNVDKYESILILQGCYWAYSNGECTLLDIDTKKTLRLIDIISKHQIINDGDFLIESDNIKFESTNGNRSFKINELKELLNNSTSYDI